MDVVDRHNSPAPTWTEWRARAFIRAAGLPQGWLDPAALDQRTAWAASELIDGQIRYHSREHHAAAHIEHRIEAVELAAFATLMIGLIIYLGGSWLLPHFGAALPAWFGGFVTVISAVSPAIGAAGLALEATNDFRELAQRSARLEQEYLKLAMELGDSAPAPLHQTQEILRAAAELLVSDADSWRERFVPRRMVQGG